MANAFAKMLCIAKDSYNVETPLQLWVNPALVMVVRPVQSIDTPNRAFLDMFDGSVLQVDGEAGLIVSMLRDAT